MTFVGRIDAGHGEPAYVFRSPCCGVKEIVSAWSVRAAVHNRDGSHESAQVRRGGAVPRDRRRSPADTPGRRTGGCAVNRQPPPPGIVATAEQDYQATRDTLATLTPMVRELLAANFTEVEAVCDVWLTLFCHDRRAAAMLGATAIVQLAQAQRPAGPMATEPGS
jgi:hypothetical protein